MNNHIYIDSHNIVVIQSSRAWPQRALASHRSAPLQYLGELDGITGDIRGMQATQASDGTWSFGVPDFSEAALAHVDHATPWDELVVETCYKQQKLLVEAGSSDWDYRAACGACLPVAKAGESLVPDKGCEGILSANRRGAPQARLHQDPAGV